MTGGAAAVEPPRELLARDGAAALSDAQLVALLLRISDRARRPEATVPSPDDAVTQVVRRV